MLNQEQTFSLDLSLFGSKVSDLNPANLPAGVSPDNSNVFYYPQGVATRPAFLHALSNALAGASNICSHESFAPPGGSNFIVALDQNQNIWLSNVISGSNLKLFTESLWNNTNNQKYFNGAQLFDKFFMAFFDPWNGLNQFSTAADVPRYVNTLGHCNRVTIDAPGGGLSVTNENLENLFTSMTVASNFQRTGNIVTATLSGTLPSPMPIPGWFVQLYDKNAAIPSYNYSSSWNRTSPLNSAAVQSATVGGNTAGNIVWVYYCVSSSYGGSIDNTLYTAFQNAQSGGYTLYVKITNPVVGPAGVFPIAYVASSTESAIPAIPNQTDSRTWYYFGYQVPGAPSWQGNVSIPPSTTATYAISTTPITPTGGTSVGSTFSGNQLYQALDNNASLNSDGSGITRITTSVSITNLPIGAWLYLVLPSGSDLPFSTGWVQVASIVNSTEFAISTPGAQIFSTGGVTLYEYWGSLNTNVNLSQPVPGNPVGTSFAQVGAQGFQLTSVSVSGGNLVLSWYQLGPDSINEGSAGTYALTPQSAEVPGNRQAFCFFVNEDGAPSPGSPPINFTTLGGPNFTKFTFPLGPTPTVQRALAVTPANGADFFTLPPANVPSSAGPIITPGTIIYDNITTSAYIDWSDQALVASIPTSGPNAAGSDYGDLTSTINLPPCLGVIAYDEALAWIGEWNNIKNLLNMSMQGGASSVASSGPSGYPLGWNVSTAYNNITPDGNGSLVLASDNSGWAYQMRAHTSSSSPSLYFVADEVTTGMDNNTITSATITPTETGNVFFFASNNSAVTGGIAGWNSIGSGNGLFWQQVANTNPVSVSCANVNTSAPYNNFVAILAEVATSGVVTQRQYNARNGNNSGGTIVFGETVQTGNTIVVNVPITCFSEYAPTSVSVSDTVGNQYIQIGQVVTASSYSNGAYLFAAVNVTGGFTTITVTMSGASTSGTFTSGELYAAEMTNIVAIGSNCMISQPAYQDYWGTPILQPNQPYEVIARTQLSSGAGGTINFVLYSPSEGTLAEASITPTWSSLRWSSAPFSMVMPENIPTDAVLYVYSTWTANGTMELADVFIVNSANPVLTNQIRFSYPTNPFGYDNENGYVAISSEPDPIVAQFKQRKYLYALTTRNLLQTFDTGEVPSEWGLDVFAVNCGGSGPNGVDSQSDVAWWIGQHGAQVFEGSLPKKVSQEIEPDVDAINWNFANIIGVASDPIQRVVYFTVPSNSATSANNLLTMNHRMVDPSVNITDPIHVSSYTGKMIATDLARKWSPWPVSYNSVSMCYILNASSQLVQAMTFGGGYASGGMVYYQDFVNYPPGNPAATSWNTSDADMGTFASYYYTYFFFAHDIEQNAMLALYRKLFCYMSTHVTGTGNLTLTPYVDAISNAWPALPALTLQLADPGVDYEFGLNVSGNRMALKYSMTSGAFWLTHLIVSARRDLVFPVGGVL